MLPDDAERSLAEWLRAELDPTIERVEVTRLAGGHSSGAWRLDPIGGVDASPLVLKAPTEPSPVFRRDAAREARILRDAHAQGAPVPAVRAIDEGTRAVGRACFAMDFVEGWAPSDQPPGSYHCDPFLQESSPDERRAVWWAFHDALAALHHVDPARVPDAHLGPAGLDDVFAYWRASLLDAVAERSVPRQLALIDWLEAHVPSGAGDRPALCMGDARLVNCLLDGTELRALVDFEIAYVGDPAADIGYSLFLDAQGRSHVEHPLVGIPSEDETWARWEAATGRTVVDRDYWKAFGAMVLAVTATRFMAQLGLPPESLDTDNPVVAAWEGAVDIARG